MLHATLASQKTMRVKFWGVRGSIPNPLTTEQLQEKLFQALTNAQGVNLGDAASVRNYIRDLDPWIGRVVSGNTTCVEVEAGGEIIIIDCGSGMRDLGATMMAREFGRGHGVAHIFLTHAHWDHLQGFPFFAPLYVPGNRITIYAVGADPRRYFDHQQVAPIYFPLTVREFPAELQFIQLKEGSSIQIGRTTVSNLALQHPGTAYAYRFDDGVSVFVFASDGEYKELDDVSLSRYIEFFSHADALAFDSQFSLRDLFLSKRDWGHSSVMIGVDIAEKAGAKKLVMVHYDPSDSDRSIYEVAESARQYSRLNPIPGEIEVLVGYDGLELLLGPPVGLEMIEDTSRDVWLLAVAGNVITETAQETHSRIADFLSRAPNHRMILDLTLVASLDVAGAAALRSAIDSSPDAKVAIVSPKSGIRRTLRYSAGEDPVPVYRRRYHALLALARPTHLLRENGLFEGRYQLGDTLDVDQFGVIYPATDIASGEEFIVHVLGEEATSTYRQTFLARARAWCEMQTPGIVAGCEVVEQGSLVAFVGERPVGHAWNAWLTMNGSRPSAPTALACIRQMLQVLQTLHSLGMVHGDLRPEFIIFQSDGPLISCAPLFFSEIHVPTTYRAPELLRGGDPTAACDIFAAGVLLYESIVGVHPFEADREELTLLRQLQGVPLSPRVYRPDLSAKLEELLLELLAPDPADRPDSARHAIEKVDKLLQATSDAV